MAKPSDQTSNAALSPTDSPRAVTVSLFAPVTAPILRSVDPVKVAQFLKEREQYELEIASKQSELPTLKSLPYSASVDQSLLKNLVFMGKFDEIAADPSSVSTLEDKEIEEYVKSLVNRSEQEGFDGSTIEKALNGCEMPMSITDADARVT